MLWISALGFPPGWSGPQAFSWASTQPCLCQTSFIGLSTPAPQPSPCLQHACADSLGGLPDPLAFVCVWPRGSMNRRLEGGSKVGRKGEGGVWVHTPPAAFPAGVPAPVQPVLSHGSHFWVLALLSPHAPSGPGLRKVPGCEHLHGAALSLVIPQHPTQAFN